MNITSANVYSSIYGIMNRSNANKNNAENSGTKNIKTVDCSENENKHKNLFGFASVSITEDVVKEKYGDTVIKGASVKNQTAGSKAEADYVETDSEKLSTIVLPASFNSLKDSYSYYYHGEKVSDYELIQTAVASGKMEIPSEKCSGTASHQAFKILVQDEAARKNEWSDTLYSEDGHYTFTTTGDGKYQMHLLDDKGVGASLEDISNWIMSGIPNRNIETRYLNYLRTVDPDLCNVAMRIGSEVRTNDIMDGLYEKGIISENQNQYDMGLLGMMFGKNADDMRYLINNCRSSGNFLELLDLYQPAGDESLLNLRLKQSEETNGGIFLKTGIFENKGGDDMGIGIGLYVKNSQDAVKLYLEVFRLELGYHVNNPDGSFFHSELNRNGESFLSVVETSKNSADESLVQLGYEFDNTDEVRRAFELLQEGGRVDMPIGELPWSPCAASVVDKFGVWWYLSSASHRPPEDYDYWK